MKWLQEKHLVFSGTFAFDPYGLPRQLLFVLGREENVELAEIVDREIEAFGERFLETYRTGKRRKARANSVSTEPGA